MAAQSSASPTGADLLFAGDIFCDLVFAGVAVPEIGGEVFASAFALSSGGVATRAVAAARSGAATLLIGRIGDDPLGEHLRTVLQSEPNLDTHLVERISGHQTAVSVALAGTHPSTGAHDRSFISYQEPLGELVVPADVGPIGAVHVGIADELPQWLARLRSEGTTVVGGVGWDEHGAWSSAVLSRLSAVDVFVPNAVEAMKYTRTDSVLAAAKVLADHVALVVITRGEDGVIAIDSANGAVLDVPPVAARVVDPTGAGDVFVATFMASARHGWDLRTRLRYANLNAAISITTLGGAISAPRAGELGSIVADRGIAGDWSFLPPSAP